MKLSYSKKIFILSLVVFFATVVLCTIYTNLLFNKIISINDKVKQQNISSQERERELKLKDSLSDSSTEREKLAEFFVKSGNAATVEFTESLEEMALKLNLKQKKTLEYGSVAKLASSDTVSLLRYRFNVTGRWLDIFTFIQQIESLPRIIIINEVVLSFNQTNVSAKEARSGSKTWSADIDFSVFKLKI